MRYTSSCNVALPGKKRITDFGVDLPSNEDICLRPQEYTVMNTGVSFEFPIFSKIRRKLSRLVLGMECVGFGGVLWPRSRSNLIVLAGVIDPEYRGEIKVKLYNPTPEPVSIMRGEFVAQLLIMPVFHSDLNIAENINETERGTSGGINKWWE